MRRFIVSLMLLAALAAGCSKNDGANPSGETTVGAQYGGGGPRGHVADILPADTEGYFRMANVQAVLRDFVQKEHVRDAAAVQPEFAQVLDKLFEDSGEDRGMFGSSGATMKAGFHGAKAIHIAMVPSKYSTDWDGEGPEKPTENMRAMSVVFVELDSMAAVDEHLKKLGDKIKTKEIDGLKVYTRKNFEWRVQPEALCKLDDKTLVIAEVETGLERVLALKKAGPNDSMGRTAAFQEAYKDFGDKGDFFAYVSFDAIRKNEDEVPKMLSTLAGYAHVGGEATLRIKAGGDFELPELVTGGKKSKQFLSRIPADSVLVLDSTIAGGKANRDAALAWLKKELASPDGLAKMMPPKVAEQAAQMLEQGDPAVSPMAVPVKSEKALCIAPGSDGRFGVALFCDIEDKAQVDELVAKLKDMAKGAPVPLNWETRAVAGTTINFIDVAKMAPPGALPDEVKKSLDMQVGYAVNGELLLIGTAGLIESILQPSGATYADKVKWQGVDRENMLTLSLAVGSLAQKKFGIPPLDKVLAAVAKEIPTDASYTLTANVEKKQVTLRTNVPISSLIGWLTVEFATDTGPAGLKQIAEELSPPRPRDVPAVQTSPTSAAPHAHDPGHDDGPAGPKFDPGAPKSIGRPDKGPVPSLDAPLDVKSFEIPDKGPEPPLDEPAGVPK